MIFFFQFFLPNMYQKNECAPIEGVTLVDFWLVADMLTFDNVGFSKTVSLLFLFVVAKSTSQ